ncbi:hypothetical protein [Aquamicrobium zhengzhouense]|uniref:RNA polymerase sigma factor 70 region 4 type 2 domain-containing protein n=1 Tax=Aquamicrobium zhengzhouense TaxID=2781738 RepID=A0ABS0SH91_9HYPH|nr:hypothetical protein [Aquamicrobium zhengzhouense]MBI1621812.1 hypothetical protein [Aquamicrobium zhengzhouense]
MVGEDKSKLLRDLRTRARSFRKSRTNSIFQIIDRLRELDDLPRKERHAVLVHDCGFTSAEASRLLGAAATEI